MEKGHKRNITPFNGDKYATWKFRIRALLGELGVLHVIDKERPEHPNDEWLTQDATARNILVEYLSDSLLQFAQGNTHAQAIFTSLDEIYERKSLATQLACRKKLLSLKLAGDTELTMHFAKFDEILAELIAAGARMDEMDKVSHLLTTLPGSYDGVITALETLTEDNLTIAFVKTRLLDQEVKLKSTAHVQNSMKALCTTSVDTKTQRQTRTNNFKNKKNKKFFKNWQKEKKNQTSNPNQQQNYKFSRMRCDHCGRNNHVKRDCIYYKRLLESNKPTRTGPSETLQLLTTNQQQPSSTKPGDGFVFMLCAEENSGSEVLNKNPSEIFFYLDSGASEHIVNNASVFIACENVSPPIQISVAKHGATIQATKRGIVEVTTNLGVQGRLENVLYSREVPYNLLSVRRLQEKGMTVIFDQTGVLVKHGRETILTGELTNGLIGVIFHISSNLININIQEQYNLWHQRLGHISKDKFLKLKLSQMIDDVHLIANVLPQNELCEPCLYGKQSRLPFAKAKVKDYVQRPLFIVHTDVCGKITPPTNENKNYFVTFIDEFTHYTVAYLVTHKSDVFNVFKTYLAKCEAHGNFKVANLYCDNGGEYLSNDFIEFCSQKGITYHLTISYTPQQNGVAERMNRTITEMARALIAAADLPKSFWGEAVLTSVYLINRSPTRALKTNKTPYEMWFGRKPSIKHLKVFGATVYIHDKTRTGKFDSKSFKGILVGYEPNGYKVWVPEREQFIRARDVVIDEINYGLSRPSLTMTNEVSIAESSDQPELTLDDSLRESQAEHSKLTTKHLVKASDISENQAHDQNSERSDPKTANVDIENDHVTIEPNDSNLPSSRRSERLKQRPKVVYPDDPYSYLDNSEMGLLLCASELKITIPKTYSEIKTRNDRIKWEQAIKDEISSLETNDTWTIVPKPTNKNVVGCRWVFTVKNDENGNPLRYKARLVAKGFNQKYPFEYTETFAPVARISTFRLLLALANQYTWAVHHMDVKTAFLNGILDNEVYMEIPEGLHARPGEVCRLNRALYGLKQSARCWFQRFDELLKKCGFINSKVDHCLYILNKGNINENIYVLLYVDDLVIATGNEKTMINFKAYLMKQFDMVDLKEIKLFLGIKIVRTKDTITLDQTAYLKSVLFKYNMKDCKSISTPLQVKLDFEKLNSEEYHESPCKNVIGCLMYAMLCTRPDLCAALNILSRYQSKNNIELWKSLKRVLRYIKGSIDLKLTFVRNEQSSEMIIGYVDADWGGDEVTRKSTTGYVFQAFNNCTITWNTKRQNSVATSSTEAEYMALYEGTKEAAWLRSLLESIQFKITEPIPIFEDNQSCIAIATNPTNHKRTKHIDIKYHFTREQVEKQIITINYLSTGEQLADSFTKMTTPEKFLKIRARLGLQ